MVRISSPFLLEYSAQSYTIAQGELVTFTNRDPGLDHGLVSDSTAGGRPLFEAPVLARGQTRLVRGVPFLGHAGSPYSFRDPAHPTMTATLVVSASGSPLPPDPSPPTAAVKAKRPNKGRGPLRLRLTVSEPVDAVIKVRARSSLLARLARTYVIAGRKSVSVPLAARARPTKVVVELTDVAGNQGKASTELRRPRK